MTRTVGTSVIVALRIPHGVPVHLPQRHLQKHLKQRCHVKFFVVAQFGLGQPQRLELSTVSRQLLAQLVG